MITPRGSEIIWEHDGDEQTLLATTWVNGRELLVAATSDHTIGLWDTADGTEVGEPYLEHNNVSGLVATVLDGHPVVASFGTKSLPSDIVEEFFDGDEDLSEIGQICVWDPLTHELVGMPMTGDGSIAIDVLQLTSITDASGVPLVLGIIGNDTADGGVVVWDLDTRVEELFLREPAPAHVDAMAPVTVDGQPLLIAAVTHDRFDDQPEGAYLVCAWNPRTGDRLGQPWQVAANARGAALTATVVSGQPLVALWTATDDHVRLYALPTGEPLAALPVADVGNPVLLRTNQQGDSTILAAAHPNGVVTVWELTQHQRIATVTNLAEVNDLLVTAAGHVIAATDNGLTAIRPIT
jgi:WD40 repeat protein